MYTFSVLKCNSNNLFLQYQIIVIYSNEKYKLRRLTNGMPD